METTQEEIHSKVLRAGRRTYFFDVRETKASDYYLTITESKKFSNDDGTFFYKKHKIYLYKVALRSEKLVIQALLHEYTHAGQDEKKVMAARAKGYANNPYEKAAKRAESMWKKFI